VFTRQGVPIVGWEYVRGEQLDSPTLRPRPMIHNIQQHD